MIGVEHVYGRGQSEAAKIRALGLAVIYRAAQDAYGIDLAGISSPGSVKRLKSEGAAWFRTAGRGFRDICAMAGVDPDDVRERFLDGRLERQVREANRTQAARRLPRSVASFAAE